MHGYTDTDTDTNQKSDRNLEPLQLNVIKCSRTQPNRTESDLEEPL